MRKSASASADAPLIAQVLSDQVRDRGADVFLIDALSGGAITYAQTFERVCAWVECGRQRGLQPGDRVAVLLPNLPAFVEVALAAACAGWVITPLALSSGREFVAQVIAHAQPRWVIAPRSHSTLLEIPALQPLLHWTDDRLVDAGGTSLGAPPDPAATGAIIYTSGTSGTPKGAAFSHRQLAAYAESAVASHELSRSDRWLAVMPLCHSNGFGSMLGVLRSGSAMIVAPHFAATRYWTWVRLHRATWLSVTPAMIAQLLRSSQYPDPAVAEHVRFVKSSSAPLPETHRIEFEGRFGLPVIEGMGCTEAGFVFLNPIPPNVGKPGSVGRARCLDVKVVDSAGCEVPPGEAGALLVRGPTVMQGYFRDPDRTADVLAADGWLRTGDRVRRDAAGFVFLLARDSELINKGGIKIAPHEIEALLGRHPSVAEAKVAAIPNTMLGEEVVAFVEPAPGSTVAVADLHALCTAQLGSFKSPSHIVVVDAFPRNHMGKVLTRELLAGLTATAPARRQLSMDELAQALRHIWRELLPDGPVDDTANFFALGGHSLLAVEMLARVRAATGVEGTLSSVYDHPVLRQLAEHLHASTACDMMTRADATVVRFGPPGVAGGPNLLCLYAVARYRPLAAAMGSRVTTVGVCTQLELDVVLHGKAELPASLADLARGYIEAIRSLQPHGPYYLLGWSFGGRLALEVARQLRAAGESIGLLVAVDTYLPGAVRRTPGRWLAVHVRGLVRHGVGYVREAMAARRHRRGAAAGTAIDPVSVAKARDARLRLALGGRHRLAPYDGTVVLFCAQRRDEGYPVDPLLGWSRVATDLRVHRFDSTHDGLLADPAVQEVATVLHTYLRHGAEASAPG